MPNEVGISFDEAFGASAAPQTPPAADTSGGISFDEAFGAPSAAPARSSLSPIQIAARRGMAEATVAPPEEMEIPSGRDRTKILTGAIPEPTKEYIRSIGKRATALVTTADTPLAGPKAVAGLGKGIVSAAAWLPESAIKGLAGLANMIWEDTKGNFGDAEFSTFHAGVAAVEDLEKKLDAKFTAINLAPENKQEEAVMGLLALIPEGLKTTGETVFETTGNALLSAGVETAVTAATFGLLKPPIAAKMLKSPEAVAKFEDLSAKDPKVAEGIKDHVARADPQLGQVLEDAIDRAAPKSPTSPKLRVRLKTPEEVERGRQRAEAERAEAERAAGEARGAVPPAAGEAERAASEERAEGKKDTPFEYLDDAERENLEALVENGSAVTPHHVLDAQKAFSDGDTVIGFHEQDETPYRITRADDIDKHTADSLLIVKGELGRKSAPVIDETKGIGASEIGENIQEQGFTTMMRPSEYLGLAKPLGTIDEGRMAGLAQRIKAGEPIATPNLTVEWNPKKGAWQVTGEDGRHRMRAIQDAFGDKPHQVNIVTGEKGTPPLGHIAPSEKAANESLRVKVEPPPSIAPSKVVSAGATPGRRGPMPTPGMYFPWDDLHKNLDLLYSKIQKLVDDPARSLGAADILDYFIAHSKNLAEKAARDPRSGRSAGANAVLGLMETLRKYIENIDVRFETDPRDFDGRPLDGFYHSGDARTPEHIVVKFSRWPTTSGMVRTFLHEAVHAITVTWLHAHPNHPIVAELGRVYDIAVKRAAAMDKHYGLDPTKSGSYSHQYGLRGPKDAARLQKIYEFVSESWSDLKFQQFLLDSENPLFMSKGEKIRSITHKVAELIGGMIGIKDAARISLLHDIMDITERAMIKQQQSRQVISGRGPAAPAERVSAGMADSTREMAAAGSPRRVGAERPEMIDEGTIITRPAIDAALRMGRRAWRQVPGVAAAEGKVSVWAEDLIRRFAPEAMGPAAKAAAARIAEVISRQVHASSTYRNDAASKVRRGIWNQRPDFVRPFMELYELGAKFKDPLFQKVATEYREWARRLEETDKAHGADYEVQDHYMPHIFEDREGVAAFFTKKYGNGWTKPGFMKERSFDMYEQAIAAGFKPKYTNIEDIFLARQHATDVAVLKDEMLRDLEKAGFAVEKVEGAKQPDWAAGTWTSPYGKKYWVHAHADLILQKAFKQSSLWQEPGLLGSTFRGAMWLKNNYVPVKLAFSLFHPIHVLTIDNANYFKNTMREILSGEKNPITGLGALFKMATYAENGVPFKAIYDNPRRGGRLRRAFQGHLDATNLTALEQENLGYIFEGGLVPGLDETFKTNSWDNFKSAIQRRSLSAPFRLPFALISLLQKPMFEVWIPNLKVAGYLADVRSALRSDPTLLGDPLRRQQRLRQIAKSTDNRYGEMQYNTLFWDRWAKDIAVLNTLSLGWQLGFLREYGGGIMDLGHVVTKTGTLAQKAKAGMLDRPIFGSTYIIQNLAYAGLLTYALSKTAPQGIMDYIYPRTGNKNPDGSDERLSTPFYTREFAMVASHIEHQGVLGGLGHLASSKASGIIGMTTQFITGINSMDQEIFDPQSPAYIQVAQKVAATLADLEPISVTASGLTARDVMEGDFAKLTRAQAVESFLGFGKAPKYIMQSETDARVDAIYRKYYAQRTTPYAQAEESKAFREAKDLYAQGQEDKAEDRLEEIVEKFNLSARQKISLRRSLHGQTEPMIKKFQRMRPEHQKEILDNATPEEREELLRKANKKLRREYEEPQE